MQVEFLRRIDSHSAREIASILTGKRDEGVTFDPSGDIAVINDGHIIGVAKCSHSKAEGKYRSYSVEINIPTADKIDDVRTKLTALMRDLLPAAVKADGC